MPMTSGDRSSRVASEPAGAGVATSLPTTQSGVPVSCWPPPEIAVDVPPMALEAGGTTGTIGGGGSGAGGGGGGGGAGEAFGTGVVAVVSGAPGAESWTVRGAGSTNVGASEGQGTTGTAAVTTGSGAGLASTAGGVSGVV